MKKSDFLIVLSAITAERLQNSQEALIFTWYFDEKILNFLHWKDPKINIDLYGHEYARIDIDFSKSISYTLKIYRDGITIRRPDMTEKRFRI